MSMIKDKIHKRQWIQKTKYTQEPLPGSFVLVNQYKIWKNCNKPNARNGSKFWMYMCENLPKELSINIQMIYMQRFKKYHSQSNSFLHDSFSHNRVPTIFTPGENDQLWTMSNFTEVFESLWTLTSVEQNSPHFLTESS